MDTRTGARWRWSNVPVPEPHTAGLLVGAVLHVVWPVQTGISRRNALSAGAGLSCIGVGLVWWAIRAVGDVDVENPATLVTTGPYAISRNPMYVGWTVLYLGLASIVNTIWLFLAFPVVVAATHRQIRQEEHTLEREFGESYRAYRSAVPRYL